MRLFIVLCCLALALADDSADYDRVLNAFDNFLKDDTNWNAMFECLMDRKPCSELDQLIKDTTVTINTSNCGKCSPEQKAKFQYYRNQLAAKHPQDRADYIKYKKLQPDAFFARNS